MGGMHGLEDLPNEILLNVLEIGHVDLFDAIALRQTSRRLYQWSQSRSFWTSVARVAFESGEPLPFTLCQKLKDLSTPELRDICTHRIRSTKNLSKLLPKYRTWRTVRVSAQRAIHTVAPLANCTYCLVFYRDGLLEIWDTSFKIDQSTFSPMSGHQGGNLLSAVETGAVDFRSTYHLSEDGDVTVIDIAVLSSVDDATIITVWQARIPPAGSRATLSNLYGKRLPFGFIDEVSLCNDILVCLWDSSGIEGALSVWIAVIDYCTEVAVVLDTTIGWVIDVTYDLTILPDGSLFCYTFGTVLDVYLYRNVRSLLPETDGSTHPDVKRIFPHAHNTFNLRTPPDVVPVYEFNISPWGGHGRTAQQFLPMVIKRQGSLVAKGTAIAGEWAEARYLSLRHIQNLFNPIPSDSGVLHGVRYYITPLPNSFSIVRDELKCVSSYGRLLVWVDEEERSPKTKLQPGLFGSYI